MLHRIYDASKLDQDAIAERVEDPITMFADFWFKGLFASCLALRQRPGLVFAHEPTVADHIGRQNYRKSSLAAWPGHRPSRRALEAMFHIALSSLFFTN